MTETTPSLNLNACNHNENKHFKQTESFDYCTIIKIQTSRHDSINNDNFTNTTAVISTEIDQRKNNQNNPNTNLSLAVDTMHTAFSGDGSLHDATKRLVDVATSSSSLL